MQKADALAMRGEDFPDRAGACQESFCVPFGPTAAAGTAANFTVGCAGSFTVGCGRGAKRAVGAFGRAAASSVSFEAGAAMGGFAIGLMPLPKPGGAFTGVTGVGPTGVTPLLIDVTGVDPGPGEAGVTPAGLIPALLVTAGVFGNGANGFDGIDGGGGSLVGAGTAVGALVSDERAGAEGAETG
jgi:hypothetical protein